jgi:hypothetical protein
MLEILLQYRIVKGNSMRITTLKIIAAITFQLAEIAVSGDLFSRILAAIQRLRAGKCFLLGECWMKETNFNLGSADLKYRVAMYV